MNFWKPWHMFGSGKQYSPNLHLSDEPERSSARPEDEISAQGLLDTFFLDKETIESIKQIINAVDPKKVKAIMEMIEVDEEGWLRLRIDLGLKK